MAPKCTYQSLFSSAPKSSSPSLAAGERDQNSFKSNTTDATTAPVSTNNFHGTGRSRTRPTNSSKYTYDFLVLNCQSLSDDKINLICSEYLTQNHNLKFLCLMETWCTSLSIDSFCFPNFTLLTHYCRSNYKGGGVGIWCHDSARVEPLNLQNFCSEKNIEICGVLWVPDANPCNSTIILTYYRSPCGDFNIFYNNIYSVLDSIFKPNINIILAGDLNLDPVDNVREFTMLHSLLNTFNIKAIINKPTRERRIIDHIFTNVISTKHKIIENFISDHKTILYESNLSLIYNTKKVSLNKRSFSQENKNNFISMISEESWISVYNENDINLAFNNFYNLFLYIFELSFPLKSFSLTNHSQKWISNDIRKSSSDLKDLYALQKIHKTLKPLYTQAKLKHSQLIRKTKKDFINKKIISSENPTKSAWAFINNMKQRQDTGIFKLNTTNGYTENPKEIANCFNNHFRDAPLDTLKSVNTSNNPDLNLTHCNNNFFLSPICEPELLELIHRKIKNKKSSGPDDIPSFLLKLVSNTIIEPLTYLINLSFSTGIFPDSLKLSKVVPIHKKGDKININNYRPIAMASIFSKILEYCFLERLENFLSNNHILKSNQFGFRSDLSTTDAVTFLYNRILSHLEQKEKPVGIFCDTTKAFDCLNHSRLFMKLEAYGIRGAPLNWLKNYLRNRKQYVTLPFINEDCRSDVVTINIGTPQGSVLAPVLFILYTNDISNYCEQDGLTLTLYADDTSVVISGQNELDLQRRCESGLLRLSQWFNDNHLLLNGSKTMYLHFHNHHNTNVTNPNILLNGDPIKKSKTTKFLGIILDDTSCWRTHCESVITAVNRACYQIRYLRNYLDSLQLLMYYHASVESRLRYGICLWGSSPSASLVFTIQKRVIRCLFGFPRTQSCRALFPKYKILTTTCLFIFEICVFVFKKKFSFALNKDIHNFNTRQKNELRIPYARTIASMRAPNILGPRIFNKLPKMFLNIQKLSSFKIKLKHFLIEKSFYNIDEFFNENVS